MTQLEIIDTELAKAVMNIHTTARMSPASSAASLLFRSYNMLAELDRDSADGILRAMLARQTAPPVNEMRMLEKVYQAREQSDANPLG